MTLRRQLFLALGAPALALAVLYGIIVRSLLDDDPTLLLACMEADAAWRAWTCEQVLRYAALDDVRVSALNRRGGASLPLMMADSRKAREILGLFVARGIDVNAGNEEAQGWTALHGMASEGKVERARWLLQQGARPDVRTQSGLTPLDIARKAQQRHPSSPSAAEMIGLLEAAERR